MKLLILLGMLISFNSFAAGDLPCPNGYESYIDKAEGGPGFYCTCPQDKISYLDKAERPKHSNGFICTADDVRDFVSRITSSDELPCPTGHESYIDKAEGGPGFYCTCPQDKISYLDKSERAEDNNGFVCAD